MTRKHPLLRIGLAIGLVLGLAQGAWATSTEELFMNSGSSTTGVLTSAFNTINYSNANFDGWDISIAGGTSNSPSLTPFGLDEFSLVASCASGGGCATDNLTILISDVNFTQVTSGFVHNFSGTISSGGAQEVAYVNPSNLYFFFVGSPLQIGPVLTLSALGGFESGTGGGSAGPGPYSLTLDTIILHGSTGVSLDGSITAVPEPGSLLLLGSGLAGLGLWSWRRTVNG